VSFFSGIGGISLPSTGVQIEHYVQSMMDSAGGLADDPGIQLG
jgi:hypothetical protein